MMNTFLRKAVFGVLLACVVVMLKGCGGSGPQVAEGGITGTGSNVIAGVVEKGPFVIGASVAISFMDEKGAYTGQSFTTETKDGLGNFNIHTGLRGMVQIEATGYHLNELTGVLSSGPITLRAIHQLDDVLDVKANVNIMTHLIHDRVLMLVREQGKTPANAVIIAEQELMNAFKDVVFISNHKSFGEISVYGDEESSALLLAVSAAFYQYATDIGGGAVDAKLTQLLSAFSDDLADNGVLDAVDNVVQLEAALAKVDAALVKENLMHHGESIVGHKINALNFSQRIIGGVSLNSPVIEKTGANQYQITASWDSVPDAHMYELEVSKTSGFEVLVHQAEEVNRQHLFSLPGGRYFLRVRAKQSNAVYGEWSVDKNVFAGTFEKTISLPFEQEVKQVITVDGGYAVLAYEAPLMNKIFKLDSSGALVSTIMIPGYINDMSSTNDGGLVFVGHISTDVGEGVHRNDLLVVKFDDNGHFQWEYRLPHATNHYVARAVEASGSTIIVLASEFDGDEDASAFLVQLSMAGTLMTKNTVTHSNDGVLPLYPNSITKTNAGSFILTGVYAAHYPWNNDFRMSLLNGTPYVAEVDLLANAHWHLKIENNYVGFTELTSASNAIETSSGYVLTTHALDPESMNIEGLVRVAVGFSGAELDRFNEQALTTNAGVSRMLAGASGGLMLARDWDKNTYSVGQHSLVEFFADGTEKDRHPIPLSYENLELEALQSDADGGYVIAGDYSTGGDTGRDVLIMKLAPLE